MSAKVTDREMQVLLAMAEGLPTDAIAMSMQVSPHTISSYRRALCTKLHARNATHAVSLAYQKGLLVSEPDNSLP